MTETPTAGYVSVDESTFVSFDELGANLDQENALEGNPDYEKLMKGMLAKKREIDRIHRSIQTERECTAKSIQKINKRKRKLRNKQKAHNRKKK